MTTAPRIDDAPVHIDASRRGVHEPARWGVEDGLTMLNHGSYGVCPAYVRERQNALRDEIDRDPPRWFCVTLERMLDRARESLGAFVGAEPANLTFVGNGTVAVASILRSIDWRPGDEVVVTDHEYAATFNELRRLEKVAGITVKTAKVPLPLASRGEALAAILGQITSSTRLVVVSHIASASSLIMPVEEIVANCNDRGIETLIDGAHTPGQIPLSLKSLRPTYYAASCHKWLCTPKGTGFVYAEPAAQHRVQPVALSCRVHRDRPDRAHFHADFDYVGTGDYTANCVIPDAIEHLGSQLPGGWPELYRRNHDMAIEGARIIREACGLPKTAPDEMFGSMVTLVLPEDPAPDRECLYEQPLWDAIRLKHSIQAPVWDFRPVAPRVLRVSAHLHNTIEDFERLAEVLRAEIEAERALESQR